MSNTLDYRHAAMVSTLAKSGEDILPTLTPKKLELLHMAVGISGEAGELLDAVKKHVFYNQPLDHANSVEELGDLEFYMKGALQNLKLTRSEIMQANMDKLAVRYQGYNYSDEAAKERADKKVG